MILERIFAATPPAAREGLRKLKYRVMGRMSPAAYWNLAAKVSAKAAICTDCVEEEDFFASGAREAELMRLKGLLGREMRVLNIGCGIGRVENAICAEVASVTGVDVSTRMIELARQKVRAPNVNFHPVDGRSLQGIESEQYDVSVSFMVLQHIPRSACASYIVEVARILKPGGQFLFQIPLRTPGGNSEPPRDHPFGLRYYTQQEVWDLLERAGLEPLGCFNDKGQHSTKVDDPSYEFYLARRPEGS